MNANNTLQDQLVNAIKSLYPDAIVKMQVASDAASEQEPAAGETTENDSDTIEKTVENTEETTETETVE